MKRAKAVKAKGKTTPTSNPFELEKAPQRDSPNPKGPSPRRRNPLRH